jgi:alpha-tubulin suppressor-like RCC1 family protein
MGRDDSIATMRRLLVIGVVLVSGMFGLDGRPSRASEAQVDAQITADAEQSCALDRAGKVSCWGGVPPGIEPAVPQPVRGIAGVIKRVRGGAGFACALSTAGSVQCWGSNYRGQLGTGNTDYSVDAVPAPTLSSNVTDLSGGFTFACAVQSGAAKCWGENDSWQIAASAAFSVLVPSTIPLGAGVVTQVSAGDRHACAVIDQGVKCWGDNRSRQLGAAEAITRSAPISVSLPASARAVAAGGGHSCALLVDGRVFCWGANYFNQAGGELNLVTPHVVDGLPAAVAIEAGSYNTCAITAQGAAFCWGLNSKGQIGDGAQVLVSQPKQVNGMASDVTSIGVGTFHACAIHRGLPRCWGGNGFNQIGAGVVGTGRTPFTVQGIAGATAVAAGQEHSCALQGKRMFCWGNNGNGELGDPDTPGSQIAIPVSTLIDVAQFDIAAGHGCALDGGSVKCWGENYNAALGSGISTNAKSSTPVLVPGLPPGVTSVDTGLHGSCAIAENRAYCWGKNENLRFSASVKAGALITTPVLLGGLFVSVTAVSIGNMHVCALRVDATVACAGKNTEGQLGDGTVVQRDTPVAVVGLSDMVSVSAGSSHTCAQHRDGRVACWGMNSNSQLGDASYQDRSTPLFVPGLTDARSLRLGSEFSCALTTANAVKCWGANYWGQLGDGDVLERATPRAVLTLDRGVTSLAVGSAHGCATLSTGVVRCWGHNSSGQLGSNTAWRLTPAFVAGGAGRVGVRLPLVANGAPAEVEPNNDPTSATPIASGVTLRGAFNDREDYFAFSKSAPGAVRIVISGGDAADTHLQLYLYRRTSTGVVEVTRQAQRDYVIALGNVQPGDYVVRIFANTDRPEVQALTDGYALSVAY